MGTEYINKNHLPESKQLLFYSKFSIDRYIYYKWLNFLLYCIRDVLRLE